jgi:pimeloyl-ACP methyl ester carboxylesterase
VLRLRLAAVLVILCILAMVAPLAVRGMPLRDEPPRGELATAPITAEARTAQADSTSGGAGEPMPADAASDAPAPTRPTSTATALPSLAAPVGEPLVLPEALPLGGSPLADSPPAGGVPPLGAPVAPFLMPSWPPSPWPPLLVPPPLLPPPLLPPPVPPALVIVRAPAAGAGAAPAPGLPGAGVVSLAANVPVLTGLVGVPCAAAIGAVCTVLGALTGQFTVVGSMRYTVSATGPAGTVVGGVPAIFIPTTSGVERFACGAITAQLRTTCTGSTVGNALQSGTVTVRLPLPGGRTADVVGVLSGPGPAAATSTPLPSPLDVVPCRDLRTLRELADRLRTVSNPRTGQTVEYFVVGDGARSNQLLVFFNGTSQVLPDWPIQMITNGAASPLITTTAAYNPAEESATALCHDYRLVFFDYPGVGLSPAATGVTHDQIASDVDALLADVGQAHRLPTGNVSIVGWSLGTEAALKYAFLSPASNPSRTIHDVILIATKPGGGQSDQTNGNGAQCVQEAFTVLKDPTISPALKARLEASNYRLLYPYQGQQPYDGPSSGCTIDVNTATSTATLNVTPGDCGLGTQCLKIADEFAANRLAFPWSQTGGISQAVYVNQRQLSNDWNYSYCAGAGAGFTSTGCTTLPLQPPQLSATNGGVCKTFTPAGLPNQPTTTDCVPLQIQGSLTVVNGPEDLYIQHTYGAALVAGYQRQLGVQKASLATYPGADGAGHGILLQHPKWVQDRVAAALQPASPSPAPTAR